MLQALQELDLTACSKLTDTSLAKVWGWGGGVGRLRVLGLEPGAWADPLFAWGKFLIGFCHLWPLLWL